jgi:hypothetical protein
MCGECCCSSNCNDHKHGPRRILTKAEKVENLNNYAKELKKELAAVEEHIQELSK